MCIACVLTIPSFLCLVKEKMNSILRRRAGAQHLPDSSRKKAKEEEPLGSCSTQKNKAPSETARPAGNTITAGLSSAVGMGSRPVGSAAFTAPQPAHRNGWNSPRACADHDVWYSYNFPLSFSLLFLQSHRQCGMLNKMVGFFILWNPQLLALSGSKKFMWKAEMMRPLWTVPV